MTNYKVRDLKFYASDDKLAGDERNYRSVYEQGEVSYIWAEFSIHNKLFDTRNWIIDCRLLAFDKDNKLICNLDASQEVPSQDPVKFIRVKWGSDTPGVFWKKGGYRWEAWVDGAMVCQKIFHIVSQGPVTPKSNPYFTVNSLRLFEGPSLTPVPGSRRYSRNFPADGTRYVWLELKAENNLANGDHDCPFEFIVNLFARNSQLKGRASRVIIAGKKQKQIELVLGWGADKQNNWLPGDYSFELLFLDQVLANLFFRIIEPQKVDSSLDEGRTHKTILIMKDGQQKADAPAESQIDMGLVLGELSELVGLETIKTRIADFVHYAQFVNLRKEKGFQEADKINLHSIYSGNPGTGKTVVAKQMGRIYHKIGLLSKGHLIQADRSDLVGEYIGHTAPRTRAIIQKALGGVLFIDEAYSLLRKDDDGRDFGKEVIEILLKQMSEHEGELAVILAGYPEEMEKFVAYNPGLKSRFEMHFEFPDYTPQELLQIAGLAAKKRLVKFSEDASSQLYKKLVAAYRDRDRTFGNARYAVSLVDESKINMALRLMQASDPRKLNRDELSRIEAQDVEKIRLKKRGKVPDIPVDEALLNEALDQLHNMVGLESIKHEIEELVKLVRYYREIGKDIRRVFSLHSVFMGNPGTGKTTVARLMADIYKALGILERGHLVECERKRLVAGFIGQTADKADRLINTAMGGVLFIDEAYALTRRGADDFGMEAIEALMKRMDEDRGLFVVIVAGYVQPMEQFLDSNPGLRSRFDRVLRFEDYSASELFDIALFLFDKEGVFLETGVGDHLRNYFDAMCAVGDPNLGNARIVRRVCEKAMRNHDLRLSALDPKERTADKVLILTLDDVLEFKADDVLARGDTRIGFY
jgi:SpoVK/Ycf46/Vps4 family AAA+-type ATPase